jgi:hypothetical protein
LGTVLPSGDNEDKFTGHELWNRIFDAEGGECMAQRNFLHGRINTRGCWAVIRNYNRPHDYFARLEDEVYIAAYRKKSPVGDAQTVLSSVLPGYQLNKFTDSDKNAAYLWFFNRVVGLSYFSHDDWYANDFNVTGRLVVNEFSKVRMPPDNELNGFNSNERNTQLRIARGQERKDLVEQIKRDNDLIHDKNQQLAVTIDPVTFATLTTQVKMLNDEVAAAQQRLKSIDAKCRKYGPILDGEDPPKKWEEEFVPDGSLFGVNRCGFRTAKDFVPFEGDIGAAVEDLTWADVYFYDDPTWK